MATVNNPNNKEKNKWRGGFDESDIDEMDLGVDEELFYPPNHKLGEKTLRQQKQMKEAEQTMKAAGWLDKCQTNLPEVDLTQFTSNIFVPATGWKNTIKTMREKMLALKLTNAPSKRPSKTIFNASDIKPNEVRILSATYCNQNFRAEKIQNPNIIDETVQKFSLNQKQERAFRIIANHAVLPTSEQLKMYLGGMAGTGKSQVIKSLIHMFQMWGEPYRFVVLAPTGTAAALLNGSTYHYMLGIRIKKDDSSQNTTTIAEIQGCLRGVEYIFIDEISMVSCNELYSVSARLAEVTNEHELPFGGMNMILSGDFAQLPATGGASL